MSLVQYKERLTTNYLYWFEISYLVSLLCRPQFAPGKYWLRVASGDTLQVDLTAGPDTHLALPGHHLGLSYNTEGS